MVNPIEMVEWMSPEDLKANSYNPNYVAKTELALLKTSLIEDGWTQPIVATESGEIVDGFHRWTLAKTDEEVAALGDGLVPVVTVGSSKSLEDRMMATIRHNRARGTHNILKMGEITQYLKSRDIPEDEIIRRLGMDKEEFERLVDNLTMVDHGEGDFSKSWLPKFVEDSN